MIIAQTVQEISRQTGLGTNEIHALIEDWAVPLMQRGIVVRLEIGRWRGTAKIDPEELGLANIRDDDWYDFSKDYLKMGRKLIMPKEVMDRFARIEALARVNLERNSFDTIWGRFVPCTVFKEWREINENIKKQYFNVADEVLKDYDKIKEQVLEKYKIYARVLFEKSLSDLTYDEFEKRLLKDIQNKMHSPESFRKSFEFETIYYFIPSITEVGEELKIAGEQEKEIQSIQKELEMKEFIQEETKKQKTELIEKFLESTVGKIREMILEIIGGVKEGIESGKSVSSEKTRKKLIAMIDKIRILDFYNDEKIRDLIDKLQLDLEKDKEYRSDDEIMKSLEDLEIATRAGIGDLLKGRINMLEF